MQFLLANLQQMEIHGRYETITKEAVAVLGFSFIKYHLDLI